MRVELLTSTINIEEITISTNYNQQQYYRLKNDDRSLIFLLKESKHLMFLLYRIFLFVISLYKTNYVYRRFSNKKLPIYVLPY